jgi:hypothetical protein
MQTKMTTKFNQSILLVFIITNLALSCKGQDEESNKFRFDYLKSTDTVLKDTTRLKMKLYFNDMTLGRVNNYLEDIKEYKKTKKDSNSDAFLNFLKMGQRMDYVPDRLKRKKIKDKDDYTDFILDSIFYQNFEIDQLAFIAESYYDYAENIRITRKEYNNNINTAIEFKYDQSQPVTFINNSVKFNMRFSNATSKEIEEFSGTVFICDSELNKLYEAKLNSNALPKNIIPNPLKPAELDFWEYRIINTYSSDINELRIDVSDYQMEQLRRKYKELQLIFIPKKIYFKDGTSLFQ